MTRTRTRSPRRTARTTNGKNAYGKCVSAKAKAAVEEETDAVVAAAETCKAMKADDAATFEATYGAKKNAFGKCVSATGQGAGRRVLARTRQAGSSAARRAAWGTHPMSRAARCVDVVGAALRP